ncbi:hypothetical protein MMC25_006801 [Agyrium rufum]|nr:hypothetical protein [Agyrium rufum]
MTPAFGFSVGDFIAAIDLCTKVARALKTTGGAASEYQQVIVELHGLQNVLVRLAAFEPTESNIDHVNAIRRMALACSFPLEDFLSKLEKYDAAMASVSSMTVSRAAAKKAKWAVFMTEEVDRIRTMISGHVISINLLLATHASETLSRLEKAERASLDVLASDQQTREEISRSTTQLDQKLDRLDENTASIVGRLGSLTIGLASAGSSLVTLQSLSSQILAFLRVFPSELRTLLQSIIRTNVRMYAVLLSINQKIAASPTLLLESNIRMEDAFGEIRTLPYEWFRYWEPFEGLLRAKFRDRPGTDRVADGKFSLVHTKRPSISLNKDTWSQLISPGADIVMLMLLTEIKVQSSSCPRRSCSGVIDIDPLRTMLSTCPECGIRFIPQTSTGDGQPALDAMETQITMLQAEEDAKLFGARNLPMEEHINTSGSYSEGLTKFNEDTEMVIGHATAMPYKAQYGNEEIFDSTSGGSADNDVAAASACRDTSHI